VTRGRLVCVLTALVALVAISTSAHASFPGQNGKIAFVRSGDVWSMNPDGTGQVMLYDTPSGGQSPREALHPAWSPDGSKIAFTILTYLVPEDIPFYEGIWVMNADGSNPTRITTNGWNPFWSPSGDRIGVSVAAEDGTYGIDAINPDGTGRTTLDAGYNEAVTGDWSPDDAGIVVTDQFSRTDPSFAPNAHRLAIIRDGNLHTVNRDFTGAQQLTFDGPGYHQPSWSPDGSKIAYNRGTFIEVRNADGSGLVNLTTGAVSAQSWQPIPINSYVRPRGASPLRLSLVPANKPCTSPDRTHGAPLALPSCGPPQPASSLLTTGAPDANGLPVRMNASLTLTAMLGNETTPADEADLRIQALVNHVLKNDLTDYTGSLRAVVPLQITDKDNTPSPGGPGAGTTAPFDYGFDVRCTANPDPTVGSECAISTTADSLLPGTIKEGVRAVWQVGQVRVDDAGPDGDTTTAGDNSPFAAQGIFIP
jgi:hypothetical protein